MKPFYAKGLVEECSLLYPSARNVLQDALSSEQDNAYIIDAHPECAPMYFVATLGRIVDKWATLSHERIPVYHSSHFITRTDKKLEELSLGNDKKIVIINMVPSAEAMMGGIIDSMPDWIFFLIYREAHRYFAKTITLRPLTFDELKNYIAYKRKAGQIHVKVDKNFIEAIFENTLGYQNILIPAVLKLAKTISYKGALGMIESPLMSEASKLYGAIVDRKEYDLNAVIIALQTAIGKASWQLMGAYIQDRLASDMLAGGDDFVKRGEHQLLNIDLESSKPKFIAGCLEIARVLRL